jgi:glycosyltransferase involved in cell wall biosynthesis
VVRDGDTGWLVPPEDPPALADALLAAAGDATAREERGARGAALVAQRYSISALVDRVEELLGRLVTKGGRA